MLDRVPRLVAFLLVLTAPAVSLGLSLVPHPLRSAIIARSAGYERGFSERPGVAILAVVSGASGASGEDGRVMLEMFGKLVKETRLGSRRTRVIEITHETNTKTVEELKVRGAEIVYFAQGLEHVVKSVPAQSGSIRRILVCANGADVLAGCTLGVELHGERPQLVLNLKQANSAGLRFDPGLLRLARIVR
jgi:hypothetical protein